MVAVWGRETSSEAVLLLSQPPTTSEGNAPLTLLVAFLGGKVTDIFSAQYFLQVSDIGTGRRINKL